MKQNYISSIILFVSVVLLTGCSDFLDTYPKNKISDANFWETREDANTALNALYIHLPGIAEPEGKTSADPEKINEIEWEMMSDIGHTNNTANPTIRVERGEQAADLNLFRNLYRDHYRAVHDVNYFIENVEKVLEKDPLYTQEEYTNQIAQARVIRAIAYMRLAFLFGDVPHITSTIDLSEGRNVTRTPVQQIWDYVEKELEEASGSLLDTYSADPKNIGHITKGAALGMKARAMLYAGRFEKAADAARRVMDMGVYSLYPSYEKLFSYEGQNNPEVILDRQYEKAIAKHKYFNFAAPKGMNGNTNIVPTRNLVEAYETLDGNPVNPRNPYANRDPRLRFTVFLPTFSDAVEGDTMYNEVIFDSRPGSGTIDEVDVDYLRSKTGFGVKKYISPDDLNDRENCGINFIILRYADILLMYAEAMIEQGKIDDSVLQAINDVRTKRDDVKLQPIAAGKSQDELREIVRHERMVELALEGLRFWDIRRWRTAEIVMQDIIQGMTYIAPGADPETAPIQTYNYGGVKRSFNPQRDYLFPIPQQERALNPALTQNPNY